MPFCPSCKYEYRPDIKKCPDCGVGLVDELPPEPGPIDLVRVKTYPFQGEAQVAVLRLQSFGITATIANGKIAQTDASILMWDGGLHVLVPRQDAEQARKALEEN